MKPKLYPTAIVGAFLLFLATQCVSIKHIESPNIAAQEPGIAQRELPGPVPLGPGQVIRIQITPVAPSTGGTGKQDIILRIQLESGTEPTGPTGPTGPTKPTPPTPPTPPAPLTGLEKELADLYASDTDPEKYDHARALGLLYRWAASTLRENTGTSGVFRKALGEKSTGLLPANVLLPLRRRVATELRTVLPTPADTQLDYATREKAVKLFDRLTAAISTITGGQSAQRGRGR